MIVGGGIVGAVAALALAKTTALKIAVLDSKILSLSENQTQHYDARVSAISLASKRIFSNLNVWEKIKSKRISPYLHMHVWDEAGRGEIHFDAADLNQPALGFIIEDSVMRTSLADVCLEYDNLHFFSSVNLISLTQCDDAVELKTSDGDTFTCKLLIAADGAHSWVREQMAIPFKTWSYGQTAIVSTVKTTLPHQATAWQRFLPTGPLAFLPLSDANTCSIVWSVKHECVDDILSLSETEFCSKLTGAFENKLGDVISATPRFHFPLTMRHVKQYVQPRIALMGDAAHTIHPLAGQGVNMGLLDAVCLAEVVSDACSKGRDFSHFAVLRRYERARKSDNLAMLAAVDGLKTVFISQYKMIQLARNAGLSLANHSFLRRYFAQYALGNRDNLPRLASQ